MNRDQADKIFQQRGIEIRDQMRSQGITDKNKIKQRIIQEYQQYSQNVNQYLKESKPPQTGIFQGMAQGLLNLPLRAGVTLGAATQGVRVADDFIKEKLAGIFDQPAWASAFAKDRQQQIDILHKTATEGADFGYLGKVKPFGAALGDTTKTPAERVGRAAVDVAGGAAEAAGFAMGIPEVKGFWAAIPAIAKAAAPTAALFGAGKGAQDIGQGATLGEGVSDAATTALAVEGGMMFFHGLGAGFSSIGKSLAKTEIGAKLSDTMNGIADSIYQGARGLIGSTQEKLGGVLRNKRAYFQSLYDLAHYNALREASSIITSSDKRPTKDFLQSALDQNYQWATDQFALKEQAFRAVFNPENVISSKNLNATQASLTNASDEIAAIPGDKTKLMPLLRDYLGRVNSVLSGGGDVSLKKLDLLRAVAPNAGDNLENKLIQDVQASIRRDIEENLRKSNPNLFQAWQESLQMDKQVSANMNNPLINSLRHAPNSQAFVTDLISGKINDPAQVDTFLGSLTNETQANIRNSFFNGIVEKAQSMTQTNSREEIASFLEGINKTYGESKLLDPPSKIQLHELVDLYRGNFQGFLDTMGQLLGPNSPKMQEQAVELAAKKQTLELGQEISDLIGKGQYSLVGEKISKITSTETMDAVLNGLDEGEKKLISNEILASKLSKSGKIFHLNEGGTYNFDKFFNELNSMGGPNKFEIWEKLFGSEQNKNLQGLYEMLAAVKDRQKVSATTGTRILLQIAATLAYMGTGRPIGAIYHGTGAVGALFGRTITPATKELEQAIYQDLLKDGKFDPGYFASIGKVLQSETGKKIEGKAASSLFTGGTPGFDRYKQTTEKILGRQLTEEELSQLQQQYAQNE